MSISAPLPTGRETAGAANLSSAADRRASDLILDLAPMQEAVDLPDLFAGLARAVLRMVHADACSVSLLDDDGHTLRDVGASVLGESRLARVASERRLSDFPLIKEILESDSGADISISDKGDDPAHRKLVAQLGYSRALICRITVEGEAIGIVEVFRVADRGFRSDDPEQIRMLASFAANSYTRLRLASKLEAHYTETLGAIASALEAKDPYTQEHTNRIRDLAMGLGIAMQIPGEMRRSLSLGAILHDVGKIGVSDSVLLKPGPLTDLEWEVMRQHPTIGEKMLVGVEFVRPALPIIRNHHERWDGGGYPDRLEGEDIPIGARIVAVCDAFDAMTSDRPYRKALSIEQASEELLKHAGTQFDPACAALLVDVVSSLGDENVEEKFVRYDNVG
ncbi:MAG TPA: HD domain-containing phosphohydrolase [Actinomycetota bacterium]|nr:HD domain-containing phosphohydrolase [Actinomycetota bacterium]